MKYLCFLIVLLPLLGICQKKNAVILSGTLLDNNSRYTYRKYSTTAKTLREFDISYYRQVGKYKNWYIGAGLGFRKLSFNEFNLQYMVDENVVIQPVVARVAVRHEQFLGRKLKYFLDGGPGYSLAAKTRTINYFGEPGSANRFTPSAFIHVQFGLKVNMTERIALGVSLSSINDIESSLVMNERKVKFSNTTIKAGVQFNF